MVSPRLAPLAALATLLGGCGPSKIIYPPGTAGTTGTAGASAAGGSGGSTGAAGAPDGGPVPFTVADLLGGFGTCAATQVRDFHGKMSALASAAAAWAATPSDATR